MGFGINERFTMRVIRCLNDEESVKILKEMQQRVMSIKPHSNIARTFVMAIVPENHS